MLSLKTPLADITSIKRLLLPRLARLGLETVSDLLWHLPARYEDYTTHIPIADTKEDERASWEGVVSAVQSVRSFKKRVPLTTATITDDSGSITAVWFNQPFLDQSLPTGTRIRLSGQAKRRGKELTLSNPEWELARRSPTHTARLVPVYPETTGITSKFLRWQIESLFKRAFEIIDPMPRELLERLHLPGTRQALRMIHYPRTPDEYALARKRFAWDEMFLVQLKALQVKHSWERERAGAIVLDDTALQMFIAQLPFALTASQAQAVSVIHRDLAQSRPMNRLLNGDVGSGKTIVAALAARSVARADRQVALLAPTEVLAYQHYETLRALFVHEPFDICLLTANYHFLGREAVKRETLVNAIRQGIPRIIIATHALLQKDIHFHKLALIVVDEQHRFGVAQRAYLQQSVAAQSDGLPDVIPHFLTMTATPIPRTLALAFFGNLDVSLLTEPPRDRLPIKTTVAHNNADRQIVYDFIKKEVARGRQAFIILPLVETSEKMTEIKAATTEHERLARDIFPALRLGLLHGRMKSGEKETVMTDFKERHTDILVATPVVEVGVDIPNASVILIEEADRFGLSQLHQFRGRVGRGAHQSYCFLFPGTNVAVENARLIALARTTDGFVLAEEDLRLRGPGSLFGARQSGLSDLSMASLGNLRLIALARDEAATLLASDPYLEKHPGLTTALTRFDEKIHLE